MPSVADNFFTFVCHTDRRGVERFLHHGECRDNCPPGHYHLKHTCVPCPSHCEVCLNSSHCKRCFRGYYLTQNVCQKHNCREGKHPSVGDNKYSIQFVTEICLSILKIFWNTQSHLTVRSLSSSSDPLLISCYCKVGIFPSNWAGYARTNEKTNFRESFSFFIWIKLISRSLAEGFQMLPLYYLELTQNWRFAKHRWSGRSWFWRLHTMFRWMPELQTG